MEKSKHDLSLMSLHVGDVLVLFSYYLILLISSLVFLIHQVIGAAALSNVGQFDAIISVIAASISGSTIFYSRKLYKASINSSYEFIADNKISPARVGTFFFFVLRPIFGAVFSIVVYALWRASVHASTSGGDTPKEFIFIVIPIGFFAGFSAGRLLEQFEEKSISDLIGKTDDK
jgi:hypothetical protein